MDSAVNALLIAHLAQQRIHAATGARQAHELREMRKASRERRGISRRILGRTAPVAPPAGTVAVPRI